MYRDKEIRLFSQIVLRVSVSIPKIQNGNQKLL